MLCVSDNEGGLTVIDVEGEVRWKKRAAGAGEGWMVRADGSGTLHGGALGVRKFDWNGKKAWRVDTGDVRFGWAEPRSGGVGCRDDLKVAPVVQAG